jgi:hypothetical protein
MRTENLLNRDTADSSVITHGSCYCSFSADASFEMRKKYSTFATELFLFL